MLIKLALLFLGIIAVIGWVGSKLAALRRRREAFCPDCGRPRDRMGAPCLCGRA